MECHLWTVIDDDAANFSLNETLNTKIQRIHISSVSQFCSCSAILFNFKQAAEISAVMSPRGRLHTRGICYFRIHRDHRATG